MQSINSITGILKSMFSTGLDGQSALKIPPVFAAVVADVTENKVTLLWQDKKIDAKLETAVKKNERLLLQLTEEKDGQQFYKVLARSQEGQTDSSVYWHTVVVSNGEMTPYYLVVKEYRQSKKNNPSSPFLDIVFPTANLGFAGLRILSCEKPYSCCFLVEEADCGKLLTDMTVKWLADSKEVIPITLKPFSIIRRQDYLHNSPVINRKA